MTIKEKWKEHPLFTQGKIELVPTDWVWQYFGTDVSPEADLMDGTIVSMDTLWKNICDEGLYEPLIMRVGLRNKKFRLESGNHRIQVFHKHGIPMVPLTVEVREECGPHLSDVMTDATHNFDANEGFLVSDVTEAYMKPSEVFRDISGPIISRPMNIIERAKKLDLPLGEYVVVGSGILDALHLRAARDLDIAVVPVLLARLRTTGEWEEEERYGKIFLKRDGIDIIPQLSWEEYPTTTEEAIASAIIIDGVPFMNLEELRKFKLALGREKDAADIALIDAYRKKTRV